jgi:Glycosyltransferase family 92
MPFTLPRLTESVTRKCGIVLLFITLFTVLHNFSLLPGSSQIPEIIHTNFEHLRHGDISLTTSTEPQKNESDIIPSDTPSDVLDSTSLATLDNETSPPTDTSSDTVTSTPLSPLDDEISAPLEPVENASNTTSSEESSDLSTFPPLPPADDEEYMALCILVRDQADDLPEIFVHHYHHMGIRRFYIMDDASNPPLSSVPDYGIPNSAITFQYIPPHDGVDKFHQSGIYNDCIKQHGSKHTWMGFIDADEFLEVTDPAPGATLKTILSEFAQNATVGAVAINWLEHTSAGHIHRQESNRQAYDVCITDEHTANNAVKSFVRTSSYVESVSAHTFTVKEGTYTVGEDYDVIPQGIMGRNATRKRLALHHYITKSRDEFAAKMERHGPNGRHKDWSYWRGIEDRAPHMNCTSLKRYAP